MRNLLLSIAAAAVLVSGCASRQDTINSTTSASARSVHAQNYEMTYRNIRDMMEACHSAQAFMSPAGTQVEAELYPESGFAEVFLSQKIYGVTQGITYTKITRNEDGTSTVETKLSPAVLESPMTLRWLRFVREYADGRKTCPRF